MGGHVCQAMHYIGFILIVNVQVAVYTLMVIVQKQVPLYFCTTRFGYLSNDVCNLHITCW